MTSFSCYPHPPGEKEQDRGLGRVRSTCRAAGTPARPSKGSRDSTVSPAHPGHVLGECDPEDTLGCELPATHGGGRGGDFPRADSGVFSCS